MFRRIVNWFKERFEEVMTPEGVCTPRRIREVKAIEDFALPPVRSHDPPDELTPEEAGAYARWEDYEATYTPVSKESLIEAMRKAAAKTKFNGGEGDLGFSEIEMQIDTDDPLAVPQVYLVRDLVELTATETKVEQWMRLHRLFCLSGDTPIVDAHKYMAARMVMDSVMTKEERATVQKLAFGSSPKSTN